MTYQCPRCQARIKDWEGDDPKCAFDENGNFLENNWNCATMNALRDMAEENKVTGYDFTYNMSIIHVEDVGFAILSWEKSKGKTEDFVDEFYKRGTLRYAQELLGDVEPHFSYN